MSAKTKRLTKIMRDFADRCTLFPATYVSPAPDVAEIVVEKTVRFATIPWGLHYNAPLFTGSIVSFDPAKKLAWIKPRDRKPRCFTDAAWMLFDGYAATLHREFVDQGYTFMSGSRVYS